MTDVCKCCIRAIPEDYEPTRPDLCPKCSEALQTVMDLAPSYQRHALAAALCHSAREIARRLGEQPSVHYTGIGNATRRSGLERQYLIRVAGYAIRVGYLERPKGFEDCNPNGWTPDTAPREVKTIPWEPEPQPKPKHGTFVPGESRAAAADKASPAVAPAVEAPLLTPGAAVGSAEELAPTESPANNDRLSPPHIDSYPWPPNLTSDLIEPSCDFDHAHDRVLKTWRDLETCRTAIKRAEAAYIEACEALAECGRVA